jgi:hypothetical protein
MVTEHCRSPRKHDIEARVQELFIFAGDCAFPDYSLRSEMRGEVCRGDFVPCYIFVTGYTV